MPLRSNIQGLKVIDTLLREFPTLFHEVVPDSADLRGGEGLDPIDAAFAEGNLRVAPARGRSRGLHVHVLQMHGVETARVLQEVFGGDEAGRDGGHLELEFDQFRIEQIEQPIVGALALHRRKLEAFVVQPLLQAGLGRHPGNSVIFVGRLFHLVEGGAALEDVGTGLGLWVTNNLVRKNKGIIQVRSSTKRGESGTIFTFSIPAAAVRPQVAQA